MAKQQKVDEILFSEFHPEYVRQKEEERRKEREKIRRRKLRMVFLRGFAAFLILFAIYLCLDISKIREVTVTGNSYLSENYLLKLAGLSSDTRYPFVFPSYVSARLESNPLVEKAEVTVDTERTVRIRLTMKKALGYHFVKEEPYIILAGGEEIKLRQDYYTAMGSIPFLKEFENEEQREALIAGLDKLDPQIISGIAEIWPFVESYDPEMYRFMMNDGNQVFMSKDGIPYMASYYGIASSVGSARTCIMINELTSNAYTRSCKELNEEEAESIKKINDAGKPEDGPEKEDPGKTDETDPAPEDQTETPEGEGTEEPGSGTGE